MSSILDALKKLEAEKAAREAAEDGPRVFKPQSAREELLAEPARDPHPPASRGSRRWTLLLVLGGIVVLSGLSSLVSVVVVRSLAAPAVTPPAPPQALAKAAVPEPAPAVPASPQPAPPAVHEKPAATEAKVEAKIEAKPEPKVEGKLEEKPEKQPTSKPTNDTVPAVDPREDVEPDKRETEEPVSPYVPRPGREKEAAALPAQEKTAVARIPKSLREARDPSAMDAPPAAAAATLPKRKGPGIPNLDGLPTMRGGELDRYGLGNLHINVLREATSDRPYAVAMINLENVYVGDKVPGSQATLIGVRSDGPGGREDGIAVQIDGTGEQFFIAH